jgi:very-short-patch-repair endonuclease
VLRALLDRNEGPAFTRSEAEERLLALVRAARLPHPELNVRVSGHEVDFLWRDARLVVEVDGFANHRTRAAFEHDRLRDAQLQGAGLTVMRVTWRQIVAEPEALLARLALALRPPHQRLSSTQWR